MIKLHRYLLFALGLLLPLFLPAQVLQTRTGVLSFYSETPLEDIKAVNEKTVAAIDLKKKGIAVAALLTGFSFPRALMQEHFNENYVESHRFPKTTFSGTYTGEVNPAKEGSYPVQVSGTLTLHGVTRPVQLPAVLEVKGGKLTATGRFLIRPEDYNISVPTLIRQKIATEIEVRFRVPFLLTKP